LEFSKPHWAFLFFPSSFFLFAAFAAFFLFIMFFIFIFLLTLEKIVTFTPNLTNIIFELDMQKSLIAVSKHSKSTPKTKDIGDLTHWDYEKIIKLKPSIAILLKEQRDEINQLNRFGIQTYQFDSNSIFTIQFEIKKLAKKIFNLDYKYKYTPAVISGLSILNPNPKKILVVIDRDPSKLKEIYVAGSKTFFDEFFSIWGGFNCYKNSGYKKISLEQIIKLNPDFIIDLTFNANPIVWSEFKWKIITFSEISPLLQLSENTIRFILEHRETIFNYK
ncbi:ABC transporter substrate-binding protein, partial [bacterium]|nr:ABC transporter substrate-binding protein [bacterium]